MDTFLNKIAKEIVSKFGNSLKDVTIVLPNRRSKVFLINQIQHHISETVFAPNICSIQELTERISGIRSLDTIEQLFEFYKVYSEISTSTERQDRKSTRLNSSHVRISYAVFCLKKKKKKKKNQNNK